MNTKTFLALYVLLISSSFSFAENPVWTEYAKLLAKNGFMTNEKVSDKDRSFGVSNFEVKSFSCQVSTGQKSNSVHTLKPSDIDVIGAIGDSLTAANGAKAKTLFGVLNQDRGVSWAIGGENSNINELVSLPNILRQYNPNLVGFSTGTGNTGSSGAGFNLAYPGDTSFEMLQQAKDLVSRIKASNKVDFNNSWKLITFFIGGNDLCATCKEAKYTAENYLKNVQDALDYFHANLPRALINMVLTLDVTGIDPLTGFTCRTMQKTLCGCALDKNFRSTINVITKNMQQGVEDLVNSGRYDTNDQFTVVVQPLMSKMTVPLKADGTADYSYFAPDCFHFSAKGHEAAAIELWANMITPVGKKASRWNNLNQPIPCPTSPYIFTNKNSN